MGKGTPSFGAYGRSTLHIKCRRCGRRAYNVKKKRCAACGYGESAKLYRFSWKGKKLNRERRLT